MAIPYNRNTGLVYQGCGACQAELIHLSPTWVTTLVACATCFHDFLLLHSLRKVDSELKAFE